MIPPFIYLTSPENRSPERPTPEKIFQTLIYPLFVLQALRVLCTTRAGRTPFSQKTPVSFGIEAWII